MTVLAIGLDAAEGSVVRPPAAAGELPEIASLIRSGAWRSVSANEIAGSGGLWPTFLTGSGAAEHGVYGEWVWDSRQMAMRRPSQAGLVPSDSRWSGPLGLLGVPGGWRPGRREG